MTRRLPLLVPLCALLLSLPHATAVVRSGPTDGAALRLHVLAAYPSLLYVDQYRRSYPDEVVGSDALWTAAPAPLAQPRQLAAALAGLADQHTALIGPPAGAVETLGVMLRTSSDGSAIVWRRFDPQAATLREGDTVLAIDGREAGAWLRRSARLTFGGNRRGRYAEAATQLGLGTRLVHRLAGLDRAVTLKVASGDGRPRKVTLRYLPMDGARAQALAQAADRPDLAPRFQAGPYRIGSIRIGAFAPQFDRLFLDAQRAARARGQADPERAGLCAVVDDMIARHDRAAREADLMVLDLRGNLGGLDRLVYLQSQALAGVPLHDAYDLFKGDRPGRVRLAEQPREAPCGQVGTRVPLLVLDDAGTRSAGEFMAAWLWAAGAPLVGERTVGAGGGYDVDTRGTALPRSGLRLRLSGNFTLFAPPGQLHAGDWPEAALVAQVAADGFAPSRTRPFAIQAVGMRPDHALSTTLADLRDGGTASLVAAILAGAGGPLPSRPAPPAAPTPTPTPPPLDPAPTASGGRPH